MPMDEYTLADIFRAMELELITSMRQTLTQHEAWEEDLGYSWEQWQISKLRAIQVFRANNQAIVSNYNFDIQNTIDNILKQSYGEAYNNSIKLADEIYIDIAGMNNSVDLGLTEIPEENFFQINDQRLNAIISEMQSDFGYANNWILGRMDNRYRDILAKSVIKLNAGATSINAAIDEATEDFLRKGIDCVVYKDGKRVNIASYAEMYLRTSAQRARLVADGNVRSRLKVYTVNSTQHLTACTICLRWQARPLIDNVYTNISEQDASTLSKQLSYPLLTEAMKDGFLHPNCRHTLYTFFPGKSTEVKPLTKEQSQKALDKYNVEQEQRKLEAELRRWKRLEKGSISDKNKATSSKMVKSYQNKLIKSIKENPNLRREYWRERAEPLLQTSIDNLLKERIVNDAKTLVGTSSLKDLVLDPKFPYDIGAISSKIEGIDLLTDQVILTGDRLSHTIFRHPEIGEFFVNDVREVISNPLHIELDSKNVNTLIFSKPVSDTSSLRAVIKLIQNNDKLVLGYKNSIITIMKSETSRILKKRNLLIK